MITEKKGNKQSELMKTNGKPRQSLRFFFLPQRKSPFRNDEDVHGRGHGGGAAAGEGARPGVGGEDRPVPPRGEPGAETPQRSARGPDHQSARTGEVSFFFFAFSLF